MSAGVSYGLGYPVFDLGPLGDGGPSMGIEGEFGQSSASSKTSKSIRHGGKASGGDVSILSNFPKSLTAGELDNWKQSLRENPQKLDTLRAQVSPIWNLVMGVDPKKGREVEQYLRNKWDMAKLKMLNQECLPKYKSRIFDGVNECPPGYEHIQSYADCKNAITFANDHHRQDFPSNVRMSDENQEITDQASKPKGCYMVTEHGHHHKGQAFFNPDPTGAGRSGSTLVCAVKDDATCV